MNGEYGAMSAAQVPRGFAAVCEKQRWSTSAMWAQLNAGQPWYSAPNGAYIYYNAQDRHWWIDAPSGAGVFKARAPAHAPPQLGWRPLVAAGGEETVLPLLVRRDAQPRGSDRALAQLYSSTRVVLETASTS